MVNSARLEADKIAAGARKSGWTDAQAAYDYCINGEVGPDNFYTYTISVYLGERKFKPLSFGQKVRSWLKL